MSDFMRTLCKIAIPVCLQKEAECPLTVEIWTRWAGVLCLFSEYNGEPDLLFRLAQVKSAAIGDGHVQLIERTGVSSVTALPSSSVIDHSAGSTFASLPSTP